MIQFDSFFSDVLVQPPTNTTQSYQPTRGPQELNSQDPMGPATCGASWKNGNGDDKTPR